MIAQLKSIKFKYVMLASIFGLMSASSTLANNDSVRADSAPERCSPYPMCKLFHETEQPTDESLRLIEPVGVSKDKAKDPDQEEEKQDTTEQVPVTKK